MLSKVRIHQFFYLILSFFLIFISQQNSFLNITDINSSLAILFLIIMSFGVSHGAADHPNDEKVINETKAKVVALTAQFPVYGS